MAKIQLNLLPDLKQKSVKTQKTRTVITSASILVTAVSVGIFIVMLLSVYVVQKKQISDANKDLTTYSKKLSDVADLNSILTVQNQLSSLSQLHKDKHASSRLFDYLPLVTPNNISLSTMSVDFGANTMDVEGTADSQKSVNTFIDTLKFTTYTLDTKSKAVSAFPSVVESNFSIGSGSVSFSLNVSFDPALFSNSTSDSNGKLVAPKLNVPQQTTTRSNVDPSGLFNGNSGG